MSLMTAPDLCLANRLQGRWLNGQIEAVRECLQIVVQTEREFFDQQQRRKAIQCELSLSDRTRKEPAKTSWSFPVFVTDDGARQMQIVVQTEKEF